MIPFEEREEYKRGLQAEIDIAHMIQERGGWVIPQYNYRQGAEGKNKGPRMRCRDRWLVLPDHDVMVESSGVRIWVEVKEKSVPTEYRVKNNIPQHGIDLALYNDYLDVGRISGNEVWLVVREPGNTWIGCGNLRTLKYDHKRPNNSYGKGGMIYFNKRDFSPIDALWARLDGNDVIKPGMVGNDAEPIIPPPQKSLGEFFPGLPA